MSPGNLYRYFPSKEALIAGIAERDRAEVAQEFASVDLSQGFFAVLEGMAQHHFAVRPDEQVKLCTEVMAEARRNPEIARISAAFDADVRKWLIALFRAAAERGDIAKDADTDDAADHADDHRRRRVVAARARSEFQAGRDAAHFHGHHAAHAARPRAASGTVEMSGRSRHEGSRITAVGLVAAAALWIASGHFVPHESAESRAALAPARPRRRSRSASAWSTPTCVQHRRKLLVSGRTEADRKVVAFARTNGILTEFRVRRGSRVKKGDISPCCRTRRARRRSRRPRRCWSSAGRARGQAPADSDQRHPAARARQSRGAIQGRGGCARDRRGRARPRHHHRAVGRRRHRRGARSAPRRSRSPARRSRRSWRSIRCWR